MSEPMTCPRRDERAAELHALLYGESYYEVVRDADGRIVDSGPVLGMSTPHEPSRWSPDVERATTVADVLAAWEALAAAVTKAFEQIVDSVSTGLAAITASHTALVEAPSTPFERAMAAKRNRSTGPAPRSLDGRRRR